jgi:hypothetical protein
MSEFIFTKHALERLNQRDISVSMAETVMRNPEKTFPGNKPNSVKFIRRLDSRNIQLVATYLKDQKKWLVISAWVRGEDDKVPIVWQLITAPFRLVWWLICLPFRKSNSKQNRSKRG